MNTAIGQPTEVTVEVNLPYTVGFVVGSLEAHGYQVTPYSSTIDAAWQDMLITKDGHDFYLTLSEQET